MKRTASRWVCLTGMALLAMITAGCMPTVDPEGRETNETRVDKGAQSYGGYQAPASDRQLVTDLRNQPQRRATRSAHALAYELESVPAVKGAAVLMHSGNAYVGVTAADGCQADDQVRSVLTEKVKQLEPHVQNIYITAEPDAVRYLSEYTNALEQGMPLGAYEQRFKSMAAQLTGQPAMP